MSWETLKHALQRMPPAGEYGFEGLTATLLSKFLDENFLVARTGDQPSGDARSLAGSTCMQAKRYLDTTPLPVREIEGDIREAIRSLPELDAYVLAITRTAQSQDRWDEIQKETGLDIIVLEADGENSALATLCVTFWEAIAAWPGLSGLGDDFQEWVTSHKNTLKIKEKLDYLKREIKDCYQSYKQTQHDAHKLLRRRFEIEGAPQRLPSNRIELSKALPRKVENSLFRWWWRDPKSKVAYLQGEEGTGKSWAAAGFASKLSEEAGFLVLWLDSAEWSGFRSLEDVLFTALKKVSSRDEKKLKRLVKKTLRIWKHQILLVLDGANEKLAVEATKAILADYFSDSPLNIRILFTTRPLINPGNFWSGCQKIEIGPFDDDEFRKALQSLPTPLTPDDISEALQAIARIPRYFNTCIELKEKFGSIGTVTKEMVLWADLLNKIDNTDPQIREQLGWQNEDDAREIISKLATESEFNPEDQTATASLELLQQCFGNKYREIRQDLVEQRISLDPGMTKAKIGADHIILGRAFYIQEIIRTLSGLTVREMADRIIASLEPIPSEDLRIEAIFIALQLSHLTPERLGEDISLKRAALIFAWIVSHNSWLNEERMNFWAKNDTKAYAEFVDTFAEVDNLTHFYGTPPVEPLARVWMEQGEGAEILGRYLKRWLLLTWSDEIDSNSAEISYEGHQFPVAKSEDHLRLSAVAVSILSLRPDPQFIEPFALCRATQEQSYRHEQAPISKRQLKHLETNIGIVMRWGFTEKLLSTLESLAQNADPLLLKGLQLLCLSLDLADVPQKLVVEQEQFENKLSYPVDIIRASKTIFPENSNAPRPNTYLIGHLAVRNDLPILLKGDIDRIKKVTEDICLKNEPHKIEFNTKEDLDLKCFWSWYAKYFPQELIHIVGGLRLKALSSYDNPIYLLHSLSGSVHYESQKLNGEIIKKCYELSRKVVDSGKDYFRMQIITELMLFITNGDELIRWFDFISPHSVLRESISLYPNPYIMSYFLSSLSSSHAFEKAKLISKKSTEAQDEKEFTEFCFWCRVMIHSTDEDRDICTWVRDQILSKNYSENENHMLFELMAASGSPKWFEEIINDHDLRPFLKRHAFKAFNRSEKQYPTNINLSDTYDQLMQTLPKDAVGWLLHKAGRENEFNRWGKELMELAGELVGNPPFDPEYRGRTVFELDKEGRVVRLYNELTEKQTSFGTPSSSTWGVDYGGKEDLIKMMTGKDVEEAYYESEVWRRDIKRLEYWEHFDIHNFGAGYQLQLWAENNEDDFMDLSENYLDGIKKKPNENFHLGLFTSTVLCIYLRHNPSKAYDIYKTLWPSSIRNGVPTFIAELWNSEFNENDEYFQLKKRLLGEAKSDNEIMLITKGAFLMDSQNELWKIAVDDFIRAEVAKDRCLGVSILAWYGTEEACQLLEDLKSSDPSLWVRDHARWAYEVCQQERSCREVYRQILKEDDPMKVSALLQVLKPALTPMAKWWRHSIKDEEVGNLSDNPKIRAMLRSFWYHWGNVHKSRTEVFGRKLEEYCRGEKLDSFTTPKLAPWWELS